VTHTDLDALSPEHRETMAIDRVRYDADHLRQLFSLAGQDEGSFTDLNDNFQGQSPGRFA